MSHIESQTLLNCHLRIEFARRGDRYGHTVEFVQGENVLPLFTSLEGSDADPWPPSPVLQNLQIEQRSGEVGNKSTGAAANPYSVALLVGMAGRSHWSLSIEPGSDGAGLVFDAACRIPANEPAELQSTYHPLLPFTLINDDRCAIRVADDWLVTLRLDNQMGSKLQFTELGVRISPPLADGPTQRWKYRMELTH